MCGDLLSIILVHCVQRGNKFHANGILCSHCIKVLDKLEIKFIHDSYIIERWKREARDGIAIDIGS